MARPLRLEFPGAIDHIIARGNAQQSIYRNDEDHRRFSACFAQAVERYRWRVHAYSGKARPSLAEVLASRKPSAKAIAKAYRDHGYRLREIARDVGEVVNYVRAMNYGLERLKEPPEGASRFGAPHSGRFTSASFTRVRGAERSAWGTLAEFLAYY